MADQEKIVRRQNKAVVTRRIKKIDRLIAEADMEKVKEEAESLKTSFEKFENAHERYHALLEDLDESDESDNYFFAVQTDYVKALNSVRDWLKGCTTRDDKVENETKFKQQVNDSASCDITTLMSLMKFEIEKFGGDPLQFHGFKAMFEQTFEKITTDDRILMNHLMTNTVGDAQNLIRKCSYINGGGYKRAMELLTNRFGNDHLIMENVVCGLRKGKPVHGAADIQALADEVSTGHAILDQMGKVGEIDCQTLIAAVINRLPNYIQNRWRRQAIECRHERQRYPKFEELVKFLSTEADVANDPVYGQSNQGTGKTYKQPAPSEGKSSSAFSSCVLKRQKCILCNGDHRLLFCDRFKGMKLHDRLRLVKDRNLCENCLMNNHATDQCRKPSVCSVDGCGRKHTKYIHVGDNDKPNGYKVTNASIDACAGGIQVHTPIVEVCVNGSKNVLALLDTASSSSFCTKDMAKTLGLKGRATKYWLNTLSKSEEVSSRIVSLTLNSIGGEQSLKLENVYVVDRIPIQSPAVNLRSFDHLQDLQICECVGDVSILIGQDHAEALVPFEVRTGGKNEPIATKTLFGWALNGPARMTNVKNSVVSHFISASLSVDDQINALWDIENEGLGDDECSWSVEDKQVVSLWDSKCKLVDEHYELPIPWRPNVDVPNNVAMAKSRLISTKKSVLKKGLWERYDNEINKLIDKGYAEKVHIYNVDGPVWYLPHHAVINDKKPEKLRIVFDCAAKFGGESLNDKCYSGPDLNNKLLHVILRFRENAYAVIADIESMYYQVLIPDKERDSLRFMWFDKDGDIVHYRMTRHLFGGGWCSSSSTYALRRVLVDNGDIDPLIHDTVKCAFYVDDCLKSVSSRDQALKVIHGTKKLLAKGGFNLTKFVANDPVLLAAIPVDDRAVEVKEFGSDSNSRALGIAWNVENDVFFFKVDLQVKSGTTRREVLKVVASIYDPLGLVNPVVVTGKIILQETTRRKLSWDEAVPDAIEDKWKSWLNDLSHLTLLRIPRCIKPMVFDEGVAELHHFSDASLVAYGSCSYLRLVNARGQIHTSLIMSKVKVAPIKAVTIPRLELQAAVVAAKVDVVLRRELDLDLLSSYFWVDSEIVLKYIFSENRRFQVFVGNRVSYIRQTTEPEQWHFVSGKDNPADLVTRGVSPQELDADKWYGGPAFLRTHKSQWKDEKIETKLEADDPEVKKSDTNEMKSRVCCSVAVSESPIEKLANHYSSWYALKRGVAWLRRFVRMVKRKEHQGSGDLRVKELKEAETLVLKHVQGLHYGKEVSDLTSNRQVCKSSSIRSLDPFLGVDGVLRVGGRFRNSACADDQPVIVSHDHVVSKLVASHFHQVAHCSVEWVVSDIRRTFWITKIRVIVKRVVRDCVLCKKLFGRPSVQKMADLPVERLEPGNPPFYYTGMDCFGPFMIKQGRKEVKRYCCVFTCLNTRAVHLEKLVTMETDSFVNAFNRFVARRGTPKKVWSDNGTNIVGGRNEMLRASDVKINKHAVRRDVEWHFNPPGASHMGGIWERVIRTARKVLLGLLGDNCRLSDEGLETLFCEIESIINSRPITKVSDDINDSAPLTPNHLLLLADCPSVPPGVFTETDVYKRRWRCVQHFANEFWRQWLKQYLPELHKRSKWLQPQRNLKVGDLVLVTEENTPRGVWPIGLIKEVFESKDGLVRSVKVKTRSSYLQRPVTKIVLLEGSQ